jgi:enoyl-CoA hydratase
MEYFKFEQRGHVQVWTITNPPMNYMTAPMAQELLELIGRAERDESTRAIVITGGIDGKFITHYSVDELAQAAADPAECARTFPEAEAGFHRMLDRIMLMPKAVIAAINGDCMGGGYELALSCDFRLAADGPYQIGLPEAVLGILPGGGGTQRLPRLVGLGNAFKLLYTGEPVPAAEAFRIGLVDEVVPAADLMTRARALAETIAAKSPVALRYIKEALRASTRAPLDEGLRLERTLFALAFSSTDKVEGVAAFLAKRKPEFTGA